MDITLENIEKLAQIMEKYKLDKIKVGDLELDKTRHESFKSEKKSTNNNVLLSDEELLYWSTSAPSINEDTE